MAGQPKRRAMIDRLEVRTRDYFEDDPTPTHLDYVACWIENGNTIVSLADSLSADLGFPVGREWLSGHLRRTFGDEAVDARLSNARAYASHAMAEQALTIADGSFETQVEVSSAAQRIKARQWTAERWNPRDFGSQKGATVSISITGLHLQALQATPNIVTSGLSGNTSGAIMDPSKQAQVIAAQSLNTD